MEQNTYQERTFAMVGSAFQSIICFASVALIFAFPPPDRTSVLTLLVTVAVCFMISFLNTTIIAVAGGSKTILKLCRYLLWVPGLAMSALTVYAICLWLRTA